MNFSREQPSPRYQDLLRLYRSMHQEGSKLGNLSAEETFAGGSLDPHIGSIRKLLQNTNAKSLLDYGAGKGNKYRVSPFSYGGETAASLQSTGVWSGSFAMIPAMRRFPRCPRTVSTA